MNIEHGPGSHTGGACVFVYMAVEGLNKTGRCLMTLHPALGSANQCPSPTGSLSGPNGVPILEYNFHLLFDLLLGQ